MTDISVAMCTYCGEEYVDSQLGSILQQTRPPDEIIIFDDDSTDSTYEIVTEYAERYPDVIDICRNTENVGVIENFQRCINQCTGDVIALSDQDDIWHPEKLERQVRVFEQEDVQLVFHNSEIVTDDLQSEGDLWSSLTPPYVAGSIDPPEDAVRQLLARNVVQGATAMFDSSLREKFLPLPSNVPHDHHIALIAAATGRIRDIDEELLKYRQHPNQVTGIDEVDDTTIRWIREGIRRDAAPFEKAEERLRTHQSALLSLDADDLAVDRAIIEEETRSRIAYFNGRGLVCDRTARFGDRLGAIYRLATHGLYRDYGAGPVSALRDLTEVVIA